MNGPNVGVPVPGPVGGVGGGPGGGGVPVPIPNPGGGVPVPIPHPGGGGGELIPGPSPGGVGGGGDVTGGLEGELAETLNKQVAVQAAVLRFSTESNLENAKHSNKKSMTDKIGQA